MHKNYLFLKAAMTALSIKDAANLTSILSLEVAKKY
jgi:hypothetical protein